MSGRSQVESADRPTSERARSITFYCGASEQPWDPDSLYQGIGGSEEALILLSRQLGSLGCRVSVFANPRDGARNFGAVRWLPHDQFDSRNASGVFVAWRKAEFLSLGSGADVVLHWVHDRLDFGYPEEAVPLVDRILMVSAHQAAAAGLSATDARKVHICGNGLDDEFLRSPGRNEPTRVIYASCPSRGLVTLLKMWPRVRSRIRDARLDVFHGFPPSYAEATRVWPGLEIVRRQVMELVERLTDQGVVFHGMVGQDRLAEGFARAGVWAYPTHCCETFCITAAKALAMGCLPVTTGMCALRETIGPWECGPPVTERIHSSWWQQRLYLKALLRAMQPAAATETDARRLEGARWARQRYSWREIALDWVRIFERVAAEKQLKTAAGAVPERNPMQFQ